MTINEAIAHLKTYKGNTPCAMQLWTPPDVRAIAKQEKVRVNKDEVAAVLERVNSKQDANEGINWETIRFWLRETV